MREALHSFYDTRYAACLRALEALRPQLAVDPLLAEKAPKLLENIRSRALVQYIAPFVSVDLATMAAAFGATTRCALQSVSKSVGQPVHCPLCVSGPCDDGSRLWGDRQVRTWTLCRQLVSQSVSQSFQYIY